ncbi:MAG TPA: bifunctional 4-hydroxy-2-oxoglutarate aldolase/2-dehydro-3-deoxy-phosphogluconate aldolase [Treponemataceae bacterium]|nr:bifunctional 4-hydroxy-2-oxoglutarate aldolase/2-dehydro-3-deoxy-phosphogluconate aldolase [Treponemataceae bacterium]
MNKKIEMLGLIPVIKIKNTEEAIQVANALLDGGIQVAEVCFRVDKDVIDTQKSLQNIADGITLIRKKFPDMLVGAGTVINADLAKKAIEAGAQFIVSPGFNPETVDFCIKKQIPIYPGVNCASQIEQAIAKNLSLVKFFPAEISGGITLIKAFLGPFPSMKFIPTGGVSIDTIGEYMQCENVAAVGGSWMVKSNLIKNKKWEEITQLSRKAVHAMHGFEFAHVGINFKNAQDCAKGADELEKLGFYGTENNDSWFCGNNGFDAFELMKKKGRGKNGHIGVFVYSIERALAYLKQYGYTIVPETIKRCGNDENSPLVFTYLNKDINGFDIHLKRK